MRGGGVLGVGFLAFGSGLFSFWFLGVRSWCSWMVQVRREGGQGFGSGVFGVVRS